MSGSAEYDAWQQWSRHVLEELQRVHASIDDLRKEIHSQTGAWKDADARMRRDLENDIADIQKEIVTVHREVAELDKRISIDISALKVRSAMVGGGIGTGAAALVTMLMKMLGL